MVLTHNIPCFLRKVGARSPAHKTTIALELVARMLSFYGSRIALPRIPGPSSIQSWRFSARATVFMRWHTNVLGCCTETLCGSWPGDPHELWRSQGRRWLSRTVVEARVQSMAL